MQQVLVALGIVVAVATPASAEEWPAWRGPRGDGTSLESKVPIQWSRTDNIAWKTPIPGIGHSSPIVHGDRVFVTSCLVKERQRLLLCLDRKTGKILWQKVVVTAPLEMKHSLNSYASSTPATDGKRIWVTFLEKSNIVAACYDCEGQELWRVSPGAFQSVNGFCSSPIPYKDMLIYFAGGNGDGDL